MPHNRKYLFAEATRADMLSEMYEAFWGQHPQMFLPNTISGLPLHALLSGAQARLAFAGAGDVDTPVPGRPCGHIFKKGESCFRCKDCALDDSCVLCARCFHATNHSDHNVSFFIAQQSGGCCDCGDSEAWRTTLNCPYHPQTTVPPNSLDASLQTAARHSRLPDNIPPVSNYPHRVAVPPDLAETMRRTIAYALDFILDTLDYSPEEPTIPENEADLRLLPSADPMSKDQYCVVVWNDDKHSFDEAARILSSYTNRSKEEASELAHRIDDEGREIIDMDVNATRLLDMAKAIARVDMGVTIRRAYDTFREQMASVIIEWLLDLTRSRLGTDALALREIIANELLSPRRRESQQQAKMLTGLSSPTRLDVLFLYHTRLWKKPRLSLKEIYASIISLGKPHKLVIAGHFANLYHLVIDAYLLVDREAETSIKYFALQLFTVPSVAIHLVHVHRLATRLLSIITAFFTNQIQDKHIVFAPSTWTGHHAPPLDVESTPFKSKRFMPVFSDLRYLCHTEPVQELIAHNTTYLLHFVRTCQLFMCVNPNKRAATSHVEYETDAWISVFNVTLSLSRVIKVYGEAFARSGASELASGIETIMHHILLTCTLTDDRLDKTKFTPIGFHEVAFGGGRYRTVEFDVLDGWVSFHHSLHWLLAEMFKHVHLLTEEKLMQDLGVGSVREMILKRANEDSVKTVVDFPLRVLAMIAQIRTGLWVRNGFAIRGQLLHYRDFMLRELCYDQDLYILQLALLILDLNTVFVTILDRFGLLSFFEPDFPSSTPPAPSSTATTNNSHLNVIQATLSSSSTSSATSNVSNASSHLPVHPVYEGPQLFNMVEEVLYIFITILSENANASHMSTPNTIRRELIHALAMGPCTFTDLIKRVAERLVEDVSFERVLKEVANFKQPESVSDSGVYELKEEMYEEVNPFFYHYTRNKREEVEVVLKTRLRKKISADPGYRPEGVKTITEAFKQEPVIVPKAFGVHEGPFATLMASFESEVLLQIVFYSIWNVLMVTDESGGTPPASAEAILDQALHLVMLGLVERAEVFSKLSAARGFRTPAIVEPDDKQLVGRVHDRTLLEVVCLLEHHEKFKTYKSRVEWILEKMRDEGGEDVREEIRKKRKVIEVKPDAPNPEEAKKRAAKARQEAIMQQMKAQQASFAINFEDEDDDLMDDEDEVVGVASGEGGEAEEEQEEQISYGTCIVCQEDLSANHSFGALGLIQASRLIRKHPDASPGYLNEVFGAQLSMDRILPSSVNAVSSSGPVPTTFPPPQADVLDAKAGLLPRFDAFPSASTKFGLYTSVCTHMMHWSCFQTYNASIKQRHRMQAARNHPECIPRKEYICPLCKSLGNVMIPMNPPYTKSLNTVPFPDWIRASGINILKSKPDLLLESLQTKTGTGEFVLWSAQDPGYAGAVKSMPGWEDSELAKMIDTVMAASKTFSMQTRHLRERLEPDLGERGAGMYLPEELVGYTISGIETALRGVQAQGGAGVVADSVTEAQFRMIRGLVLSLTRMVNLNFKGRPDEGKDAVKQAIIKRLLPEWSRSSLTSYSYPLLLRDPFTILVETAAVAPEMLRHIAVLTYYASLARAVIGIVYTLSKTRSYNLPYMHRRNHEDLFGDIRMFFISVARHSPLFERSTALVLEAYGEPRVEKLLYAFTLPFLRKTVILCRAVCPNAFPTPQYGTTTIPQGTTAFGTKYTTPPSAIRDEYTRLLYMLGIPPLSDLPNQDTLQNALSGWCAHYGQLHSTSQIASAVTLEYPAVYRLAKLPLVLDTLFGQQEKALTCPRCQTVPLDCAVCLICGVTCCMQSHCCMDVDGDRGECNMHTRECGGTIGVYFLVRRCAVLYLNSNNGTFVQSPYLDAHGEVDMSMRRGRRQYLHHARWEDIRKIWLNHGIPHVVARKLESVVDNGGWEAL
ncbi:hypothetical protein AX16_003895 [Volvariella volvacea WC 439]|nr:hypothetical protein AX16_003895 [Volvariella volvacea WC 439]